MWWVGKNTVVGVTNSNFDFATTSYMASEKSHLVTEIRLFTYKIFFTYYEFVSAQVKD